ncbi:SPFH domain-containing protein [Nocardioides xinjiangensis]|uniref:SPFH domain-containing protein n=1 Tax=Nocardioides xinjiangensis TaxID=2817376 RepID=UPI001B304090|nr:SPFH domain-containing protein [Nocardioides sp. SYSU D00778]
MGLFARRSSEPEDLRDRDYVLTGCPLVTQDSRVVLVDATVRLSVRRPAEDRDLVLGYDSAEEAAIHAVCVVVLRLMAAGVPSDELLVGRSRVAEALEQGLALAPVAVGLEARVLSVEVRSREPGLVGFRHEFRIARS